MLNALRHIHSQWAVRSEVERLNRWADLHGFDLRRVRGQVGCVLEVRLAGLPGRIEWGPPQRGFIDGAELRIVADGVVPQPIQLQLINRALQESLESAVYAQYVGDVQTRLDEDAPPEARCLILLDRVVLPEHGECRSRYALFASRGGWALRWADAALLSALNATVGVVPEAQPVVMSARAGRLVLRTTMPTVDAVTLGLWVSLFEQALRSARDLELVGAANDSQAVGAVSGWPAHGQCPEVVELPEPGPSLTPPDPVDGSAPAAFAAQPQAPSWAQGPEEPSWAQGLALDLEAQEQGGLAPMAPTTSA